MKKVRIITHSGCDLSFQEAQKHDFTMIPDFVIFGTEEYRNNLDIFPETFYERLADCEKLQTSAHPSLSDYLDAFRSASDYEDIIFIALTSKMTGAHNSACLAAQILEEESFPSRIHVYDSLQVSFGAGILVLEAARMAHEGASAEEILQRLDELVPRIGVFFVLKTLKYAYKGGRVGAISKLAVDNLGVKPLLVFDNGTVSDLHFNRTLKSAVDAIFKKFQQLADEQTEVYIFHACNEKLALSLKQKIQDAYPHIEPHMEYVGPVLGIYTGIGGVGMAFIKKES